MNRVLSFMAAVVMFVFSLFLVSVCDPAFRISLIGKILMWVLVAPVICLSWAYALREYEKHLRFWMIISTAVYYPILVFNLPVEFAVWAFAWTLAVILNGAGFELRILTPPGWGIWDWIKRPLLLVAVGMVMMRVAYLALAEDLRAGLLLYFVGGVILSFGIAVVTRVLVYRYPSLCKPVLYLFLYDAR